LVEIFKYVCAPAEHRQNLEALPFNKTPRSRSQPGGQNNEGESNSGENSHSAGTSQNSPVYKYLAIFILLYKF
jgi:hypothetical protein